MPIVIDQLDVEVVAPPAAPTREAAAEREPSPEAQQRAWVAALAQLQRQQARLAAD